MSSSRLKSWIEHSDLVDYYSGHRDSPDDLYPSEERFLPWLAEEARTVLDVGCGAGGFADIWHSYDPGLEYEGVDASEALVEAASSLRPGSSFRVADCAEGLPFGDRHADVVAALGWLHWEPRYAEVLEELWRVTGRFLFFDLRMHDADTGEKRAEQRLALSGPWDGRTTVPYICTAWPEIARKLRSFGPARILAHGYRREPAETVVGVDWPVCFATFVLERGASPVEDPVLDLELPVGWPLPEGAS